MAKALQRPYRGLRGDFVLEQKYADGWVACVGGSEERCRKEARRYTNGLSIGNGLRITPNRPGDPRLDDSIKLA